MVVASSFWAEDPKAIKLGILKNWYGMRAYRQKKRDGAMPSHSRPNGMADSALVDGGSFLASLLLLLIRRLHLEPRNCCRQSTQTSAAMQ